MMNYLLYTCKFASIGQMSQMDIAACFITAAIHDYAHPGVTNAYLIN